jgi:hypothetical protein
VYKPPLEVVRIEPLPDTPPELSPRSKFNKHVREYREKWYESMEEFAKENKVVKLDIYAPVEDEITVTFTAADGTEKTFGVWEEELQYSVIEQASGLDLTRLTKMLPDLKEFELYSRNPDTSVELMSGHFPNLDKITILGGVISEHADWAVGAINEDAEGITFTAY